MKKPSPNKPNLTLLLMLAVSVTVAGLCLAAFLSAGRAEEEAQSAERETVVFSAPESVVLDEREPERWLLAETPAPTAAPLELPEGAVEVLTDRIGVLALSSRAEAEQLLTEYLEKSMIATPTERTLSARFAAEIIIADASGKLPLTPYAEALEKLLAEPSLVPVALQTERRELQQSGTVEVKTREDAALALGSRIVSQVGQAGETVTTTWLDYRAGQLVSGSDPISEILLEPRSTLVRSGTYLSETPDKAPGRTEGEIGRSAGTLSFTAPMRGVRISSYFGTREGRMHLGVDYEAKAGTELLAPEEGVVIYCGERGEYGFVIDIDHGGGFVSRLTHCEQVQCELNQRVFKGETVARLAPIAGDAKKRPHLHFELLIDGVPHNPVPYL